MYILTIKQHLYYNTHRLLTLKNNILITILLKLSILLLISLIYNSNFTFCMFNGEESDRLSDIPPLDDEIIEHHVEGILFHKSDEYAQSFQDIVNLPNTTFEEKLDVLKKAYTHDNAEKQALEIDREFYYNKAMQRHESLLEAKETIRQLQERIAQLEQNNRK